MLAAMAPIGLDVQQEPLPFDHTAPMEMLHEYCNVSEAGFGELGGVLVGALAPVAGVTSTVQVIRGTDNNDITLFIHRPTNVEGSIPGILHLHGGGMVILEAASAGYTRWRDELAATGMVVVGVEFRNGGGKLGPHPFPAGLNDCSAALQWVTENRANLGISKLVVSGESGGGNLTLATALKAKADGKTSQIDGVYAQCPYISGVYADPDPNLTSLFENDNYFLSCSQMAIMAKVYDPSGEHAKNLLAWPYHATVDDLKGLPPHVISVNQLDPLRDEGIAYFRKLAEAGVSAVSRTVNGTCHAGDCLFREAMPDVYLSTIRDIKSFAASL